ncbi:S9 family peptidase [Brevibacterium sp. HMSC22B09]|uniref:S9 family peptidase n=1 Tax=Brevibacterium sp. HMSC22B09 TaxID=1581055 RepID=UPI0008A60255|nr:S9 family peptidase [Brevibacterium sp. HMSC22B09]OFT96416.1 hypothetical protein HMPREF3087_07675 [Brevibacterium sp. HMSC22B09]
MTGQSASPGSPLTSPITAELAAAGTRPIDRARFAAGGVLFSQRRAGQQGVGIFFSEGEAQPRDILPENLTAGSRVHEYGGGAWDCADDGTIVFVDRVSQRLYTVTPGTAPQMLTDDSAGSVFFGDITAARIPSAAPTGTSSAPVFTAVREFRGTHPHDVVRDIVLIDPSADTPVRSLFPADWKGEDRPHFVAYPRLSPDAQHLAFIGWDHPDMPWDATRLLLADLDPQTLKPQGSPVAILGAEKRQSILQPEWLSRSTLTVSTDARGSWSVVSLDVRVFRDRALGTPGTPEAEVASVLDDPGEIGGPLWTLGSRWYLPVLGGQRIVATAARDGISTQRTAALLWADSRPDYQGSGPVDFEADIDWAEIEDFRDTVALIRAGGRNRVDGLYTFDIASGELEPVALSIVLPESWSAIAEYLPRAEVREYSGIQAVWYPPRRPDSAAEDDRGATGDLHLGGGAEQAPPCVAFVHGGPTSRVVPRVTLHHAYFTSRGIAVIDVNYRGSTGMGRQYREALKGQWGVLDVADTVTVAQGLAEDGLIDPDRVAISGGSAGGLTVLQALTTTDVFACGSSYYGVVDLRSLAEDTHDFESRYLDGLVGGGDPETLRKASPLARLEDISAPVAVFQGEKDAVVPPNQARALIDALEKANLPYAARFFPSEAHGFSDPEAIRTSLEEELSFYGRIMGFPVDVPPVQLRGRGR